MAIFEDQEYELNANLLGDKLKENTRISIEEKTEAAYKHLLSLSESASKNGKNSIKIFPSDDTANIFKDKRIYNSVSKMFKNESINFKLHERNLFNDRPYIIISW